MSTEPNPDPNADPPSRRRRAVGLVLGATAAAALLGAAVGYGITIWTGLEAVTVLEMAVPVTPGALALYGGVTVGVFLVTLLLVVQVVSRFDELERETT